MLRDDRTKEYQSTYHCSKDLGQYLNLNNKKKMAELNCNTSFSLNIKIYIIIKILKKMATKQTNMILETERTIKSINNQDN